MPKTPDDHPRPPPSFRRFEQTMKKLLKVSKEELDQRLAAERAQKQAKPPVESP